MPFPSGNRAAPLPIEVGFLVHDGLPSNILHDAGLIATLMGTTADRVLISRGYVSEDTFYRSLARELAVPFMARPKLGRSVNFPASILAGIAPLPSEGLVMAPSGLQISRLLRDRRRLDGVVLTTPSRLMAAVFRHCRTAIADSAAYALPDSRPDLSNFGNALSTSHVIGLAAISFGVSFSAVTAPMWTLFIISVLVSPLFAGLVLLRLAAALLPAPLDGRPSAFLVDRDLPIYTIVAALYREKRVAHRLVSALAHIDYPPEKLDIKLVLEADDPETIGALTSLSLPGFMEVLIAPPGQPRTKPRALNIALPLARGALTVLYDAEDIPDRDQLRLAAAAFSEAPPEIVCLQARLTIDNTRDTWLTRLFTIEYATLFDVVNPGFAQIGCPIPLGGTSNHFRTEALRALGGWDAWNVTEDADLGIRLARFGFGVGDLPSSTYEEAPTTFARWIGQRRRWMKGYLQTCRCHARQPWRGFRELGTWRFAGAVIVSAGTVVSALAYPLFMGLVVVFALRSASVDHDHGWMIVRSASVTLFLFGLFAMALPAIVGIARRRLWTLLPWILVLPIYYALISLAAWLSLLDVAISPFGWKKTSHGHARTSRSARLQKHQASADSTMSLKIAPP